MDLLLLLVDFGYYVDKESLKSLVTPLRALINGRHDVVADDVDGDDQGVIFSFIKDSVSSALFLYLSVFYFFDGKWTIIVFIIAHLLFVY